MNSSSRLVIIDGNAIIHRAYHAIPPLTIKDGTMVNAVYGFATMLLRVIDDLKPSHLVVTFDVAGGSFRNDLSKDYKATRVKADQELYDQIPLVHELVRAFGVPVFTKKGYEADDLIGTITNNLTIDNSKLPAVIVTGDMDMLQLVDDRVSVYALRKGMADIVMFGADKVRERYGFGPDRIVDYKALAGDTSDNIKGVSGIGEKTATALIQQFGSIEDLYAAIHRKDSAVATHIKPAALKKLEAGEEDAKLSKTLATIKRDVPDIDFSLEQAVYRGFDQEAAADLLRRLEFFSLLKRLSGEKTDANITKKKVVSKRKSEHETIEVTEKNIQAFFTEAKNTRSMAVREIVSSDDALVAEIVGLVFYANAKVFTIAFTGLTTETVRAVYELFTQGDRLLIGHDLKRLVKVLLAHGIEVKSQLFDIMIASYVINSSTRAHDLPSILMRELGDEASVSPQGNLFGPDMAEVAKEAASIYAVYERFARELGTIDDRGLFDKIEMALIPVLAAMELRGIAVDVSMLGSLSKSVAEALDTVTKKIWELAGEEFNVASSQQLRDILFTKLDLPIDGVKKGKTGFSTAASELEKLRDLHPIIPLIEEHRELAKLQNTYVDVLPTLIHKKTGRIHTSYNQAVAATGRLSSTDPNLQNIPVRTELGRQIRDAFVAAPGYTLLSADYSQIELRIVASLANDERLIQIFKEGKDVHQATAAAIHGVPLEQVTKEMRYAAKEINFGVLYGMGAFGLAWRAGIPQWQAQEFIKKYFTEFAGVKKYVDETLVFAKKEGYVETLFGRRRYIPELKAQNYQLRNAGERMAINMPIQGTAADLMKLAMINVDKAITASPWQNGDVKMLLQVHDELVLEVKIGLEQEVGALVKSTMEQVVELRVPTEVHVGWGARWGELK